MFLIANKDKVVFESCVYEDEDTAFQKFNALCDEQRKEYKVVEVDKAELSEFKIGEAYFNFLSSCVSKDMFNTLQNLKIKY